MSSFAIYVLGFGLVLAGLIYGAILVGVAVQWIVVGAVVLLGIGVINAVSRTRAKDPPAV